MPAVGDLLAFAAASLVLLVIPGPAVLYIVNRSLSDGRAAALASVGGLETGNLVHAIAATVGLSAVVATSATAFNIVKWAGAVYLIGVGLTALLRRPGAIDIADDTGVSMRRAYAQGVVVNVLNPKVALFFLSYLPQFIDTSRPSPWTQVLTLGVVFVLIGSVTDSTWAIAASSLRRVLLRGRALGIMRRWVSGSVFVTLGVLAARAHRTT